MRKNTSLFAGLLLLLAGAAGHAADRVVTVFAASSLTDVLDEIGRTYKEDSKVEVRFSYAASSALARQVEAGAPADAFVSADEDWMNYLAERKLIQPDTRADVATNALVLVAPADSKLELKIGPKFKLAQALGEKGRIATGDPASVPVGKYARAALTSLGVWDSVADRIVAAENVRSALNFVALGETPLGIVYSTDAKASGKVRVVDTFPASSHDPISYPAAVTTHGGPDAAAFVKFLHGEKARAIFVKYGFGIP
ncbi:MAG TPA: molybdate ABC transporter substrate-binding protein [Steroidobacteraceae bacterium]|nr:molybdate ABC transporter substrate-binding protein [Steroidobacteraceae bacterium]